MFSNRQTRRRFQLGNLARLLQLRQSVSHQSPPQLQPPTTLPSPEPKSSLPLSPKSKEESRSGESQPQPLTLVTSPPLTPEAKTPHLPPSTLNTSEESQSHLSPPLPPFKSIDETRFRSLTPSQSSPPLLPDSGESQPSETKTSPSSPSTLNTQEKFQSQKPPLLLPSKSINETMFQSSPPSLSELGESKSPLPPPAKSRSLSPSISPPPPSKSVEEPKSTPPLSESKSQTHSSPLPSPLLSPKASENLQSQSHLLPPSPTAKRSPSPMKAPIPSSSSSPATNTDKPPSPPKSPPSLKSEIIPSTKRSLPQIEPNPIEYHSPKPKITESHTSPNHNKDHSLMKIPGEKENPETEITTKMNKNKENSVPVMMMMMFVNSNVQGIVTSLSIDSSSIDNEPGVHLTIDYHQTCDFSSTIF